MIKIFVISTAIISLFSGCATKTTEPEINFEPPKYVEQMPSRVDDSNYQNMGSIFGQGDNPLFSDHKAMRVNDIVTVVISENATSSNSAQKSMAETDSSSLGAGLFAGVQGGLPIDGVGTQTGGTFSADSTSNYAGSGATQRAATFTTTISARVVKVLENGNYFISGAREIMIDGEKQKIQITGVVRPYDINQANQITSAQVADAKILYSSQGDTSKATNQGWGTKMVQSVWPF
ncbi:MAG: flagellar basal body L-ring protein FlgH [Campylobacterota bacterium]|nr:flagellar basal body L-ring protein FlgH [Campylobacterota bacterium]